MGQGHNLHFKFSCDLYKMTSFFLSFFFILFLAFYSFQNFSSIPRIIWLSEMK